MNVIFSRLLILRSIILGALAVFLIVFIFMVGGRSAFAQASAPSSVEPGQFEQQFEEHIKPKVETDEIVKPLEESPAQGDDEVTFALKGIKIIGNEALSEAEIGAVYQSFIGTDVSFATLNKIAGLITEKYREEGFILARAYIPPQKVSEGIVEIKIVEGFIDRINIEGDVEGSRALLDSFISKIQASRPLRSEILERYMLLMDDLPGVTARGLLKPSDSVVGAADLVITIKHKKTELSFEGNNRGTKFLGPYQFSTIVRANSWMERYDRTYVRFVTTNQSQELKFLDLYHAEPIGSEGATVSFSMVRSTSQPGSTLKNSFLDSENISSDMEVSYPIIRAREQNLFARTGISLRETTTDASGERLTKDSVRAARIGAQYDRVDPLDGVNLIDVEVSQGLDFWNATNIDSGSTRSNAESNFTKVVTNLSRYQPLSYFKSLKGFGILIAGIGQYASGPLLASEEIGIGGSSYGRAYDPSEISGDYGAAAKIELQYVKFMGQQYLFSYQAYVFYDGGAIWNEDSISGEDYRSTLQSAGMGVKMNFTEDMIGSLEVGVPLTRAVASEGQDGKHDPRFFFSVIRKF